MTVASNLKRSHLAWIKTDSEGENVHGEDMKENLNEGNLTLLNNICSLDQFWNSLCYQESLR